VFTNKMFAPYMHTCVWTPQVMLLVLLALAPSQSVSQLTLVVSASEPAPEYSKPFLCL